MKYFVKTKTLLLLAVAALGLGIASCKKNFLDVNNNPNSATSATITPELIFPSAAVREGAATASTNLTFLDNWMGYFSVSGDFVPDEQENTYNLTFAFGQSIWDGHYEILFDLYQTKQLALAKGDSVLAGASMILSVKLWQELVDLFGDIPYSQAFNIQQTSTPGYDKDSAVYRQLHGVLDQAIGYMKGTAAPTFQTVVGNIVHFGSATTASVATQQTNWIHFANTLKLRLLIRTSEVTVPGIDRNAELAKIIANGGVLQSGQSVNENPGYSDEVNKQSPFYANYGFTPTGTDANTITRANKYTVDSLSARSDPRLTRFYRGVGGTATSQGGAIVGTTYGLVPPAGTNPAGAASSKMGFGTANNAAQDQWIFTSVESLFLQAEAVARGWLPGDPATAYAAAVTESFIWLGVPSATTAATTYMANNTLANYANANSTTTSGFVFTPVKFIAYQKYIAMNSIDPIESYSDLRRLHMIPDNGYISVNPKRKANNLPNRLPYPQEEYTLNYANVSAEGTIDITTIFTTSKIFWQP